MTFTPGTRLGAYTVGPLLGVGGMGEVYRATDNNLGREVAIKVLPELFAQDAQRSYVGADIRRPVLEAMNTREPRCGRSAACSTRC